ncbi:heavy metal-associated isoprenylated plant protein 3-like [Phalaenopsis equestris]|uniref:heavy metal-associated isoprenylated plant protein 3-like n=1 Tax=Phalaenopsis equestris TaxID=78828 RepID=UPI0009E1C9BE|nr:heavy metal-associated isoprenylated plant protein 3-like [Phalaenopsis equestris]
MGENKDKGDEKEKKGGGSEKKKEGGGSEKKEEGPPKVVLKVDMHCEGCASKIKRSVKGFEGVEGVTLDMASNKLTVIGTADPWKLRDHVEAKTRKKVEILSPASPPKKDADGSKKPAATDSKKTLEADKKPPDGDKKPATLGDSKEKKKPEDKISKEPAASAVVLKIRLHCDGCIQRIKKTILKIKGVQDVSVDAQKDLVTVKGTMDVNSLPQHLKEKLNRGVEIVAVTTTSGGGCGGSEKKDKLTAAAARGKEKGSGGGGGGAGIGGGGVGSGEKKGNGGGGGGEKKVNGSGGKKDEMPEATVSATAVPGMEANRVDHYGGPYGYRAEMLHAPQLFSDENPNACSLM